MTSYTLTLKFKAQDDLEKVKKAGKRIVLTRPVQVDGPSGTSWTVAWAAFDPVMSATLQWPDSYYLYATTVRPEDTLVPDTSKATSGGPEKDGTGQNSGTTGDDSNHDKSGSDAHKQTGPPPPLFMLSPTPVQLGLHYSLRDGDFASTQPDNGIGPGSIKVFNWFQRNGEDSGIGIGLAQQITADKITLPTPQPDTPQSPDCAPLVVATVGYRQAVTLTPGNTVKVAVADNIPAGRALKSGEPAGALPLSYDANTTKHSATYDPSSGAFKLDGGNGG